MSYRIRKKEKLNVHVSGMLGQIKAIEHALNQGHDYHTTLQSIVTCKKNIDGFIIQLLDSYIRLHIVNKQKSELEQTKALQCLMDTLKTCQI